MEVTGKAKSKFELANFEIRNFNNWFGLEKSEVLESYNKLKMVSIKNSAQKKTLNSDISDDLEVGYQSPIIEESDYRPGISSLIIAPYPNETPINISKDKARTSTSLAQMQ